MTETTKPKSDTQSEDDKLLADLLEALKQPDGAKNYIEALKVVNERRKDEREG